MPWSKPGFFMRRSGLTAIILTKLDGTAKGGIVLAIVVELGLPIVWLGIGEQADDLRRFDAAEFATALVRPRVKTRP